MTPFPRAFMRYCQHLIRGVVFNLYLVIPFFYLWFLISKATLFSTPSFSKHHHLKSSFFLLNPISKQYYAALVVHNSIFRDHVNTTLCFCNMITLIKDMLVSCLHIHKNASMAHRIKCYNLFTHLKRDTHSSLHYYIYSLCYTKKTTFKHIFVRIGFSWE